MYAEWLKYSLMPKYMVCFFLQLRTVKSARICLTPSPGWDNKKNNKNYRLVFIISLDITSCIGEIH